MATVNRPTDVKQKEADINQKLQLYGIYAGMFTSFLLYWCSIVIKYHHAALVLDHFRALHKLVSTRA